MDWIIGLQKAIDYIEQRLFSDLSVEEICSELFVTKSHLHHVFKNELGTTPKKYITEKRLILAKREITAGEKPTSVFRHCGFQDYTTFYRADKLFFGNGIGKIRNDFQRFRNRFFL